MTARPGPAAALAAAGIADRLLAPGITPAGRDRYRHSGRHPLPARDRATDGGEDPSKVTAIAPSVAVDLDGVGGRDHKLLRIAEAGGREELDSVRIARATCRGRARVDDRPPRPAVDPASRAPVFSRHRPTMPV